jgi:glycine betaine/proline transport system permease protein
MEGVLPKLPLANWIDVLVDWMTNTFGGMFDGISTGVEFFVEGIVAGLGFIPTILLIILVSLLAWKVCNIRIALFALLGLLLIDNLGYWGDMLETLALVLTAVLISIVIGIPVGIWASQNERVRQVVTPILDLMQTMPAFVSYCRQSFSSVLGWYQGVLHPLFLQCHQPFV